MYNYLNIILMTGPFKEFIMHPTVLMLMEIWEEHIVLDIQIGEPIVPFAVALIVLSMVSVILSRHTFLFMSQLLSLISVRYTVKSVTLR